jgi:hypothetical protein
MNTAEMGCVVSSLVLQWFDFGNWCLQGVQSEISNNMYGGYVSISVEKYYSM